MTDKTLGQVAMETFASLIRTDGSYPGWSAHTPDSKAAWQAAAEAVAKHIQKGFILNSPEEDAVIEAAKGWHAEHKEHDNEAIGVAIVALSRAVEALQEVEE